MFALVQQSLNLLCFILLFLRFSPVLIILSPFCTYKSDQLFTYDHFSCLFSQHSQAYPEQTKKLCPQVYLNQPDNFQQTFAYFTSVIFVFFDLILGKTVDPRTGLLYPAFAKLRFLELIEQFHQLFQAQLILHDSEITLNCRRNISQLLPLFPRAVETNFVDFHPCGCSGIIFGLVTRKVQFQP